MHLGNSAGSRGWQGRWAAGRIGNRPTWSTDVRKGSSTERRGQDA